MHVGLAHLDIVQAHDGVDLDRMSFEAFAHDLAMDLRVRRHRDDEIAADFRLATEATARREGAAFFDIALYNRTPGRDVIGKGGHAMLGETSAGHFDLAASANATPAADRIEIDAEPARRVQDARALGQTLPLSRWRENDEMVAHILTPRAAAPFATTAPLPAVGAPPPRPAISANPGGANGVLAHRPL